MKRSGMMLVLAAALGMGGGCVFSGKTTAEKVQDNDREIAARLQTALGSPTSGGPARIEVDVREGVVALSGFVPTQEERDRAGQIASATPGVRRVENRLMLPTGRGAGG